MHGSTMCFIWRPIATSVLVVALTVLWPVMPAIGQESFEEILSTRCQFSFKGTVKKLNAATIPEVLVSDRTVIVQVDQVLQGPISLGDYTGKEVTVLLKRAESRQVGQQYTFCTTGWIYGTGLAVKEVVVSGFTLSADFTPENAAKAQEVSTEKELRKRLDRADAVIVGRVLRTGPLPKARMALEPEGGLPRLSEHDPKWREAVVAIEDVGKGDLRKGQEIRIPFPSSRDVVWYQAPKFKEGQEGVWLLHRKLLMGLATEEPAAIEPLDFMAKDQKERVWNALKKR